MKNPLLAIFEADEWTCFGRTVFDTAATPVLSGAASSAQFFCINPLAPSTSRHDGNVIKYRNILLEFDRGTREEQLELIRQIPHTLVTWSGGKSYHAILSLEEPLTTRAEYNALVRRIFSKVPGADASTKNPSRFSRTPNAVRDTGEVQSCISIGQRISNMNLAEWLGPAPAPPAPGLKVVRRLTLHPETLSFMTIGAPEGQRNACLFRAACDMARNGWPEDEILERASQVLDMPLAEMLKTIRSAVKAARADSI